jgi:hypothetical protein
MENKEALEIRLRKLRFELSEVNQAIKHLECLLALSPEPPTPQAVVDDL